MEEWLDLLPLINTLMVSTSGIFVMFGWWLIRQGRVRWHMWCMLTGTALMTLFFISYLGRIYLVGFTPYEGTGLIRTVYLSILASHIVLATASVPLVLITLYRAWQERFDAHRRIARWTAPVWLYVAATGAIVFYMLHVL